ncbi:hypothetical protein CAOG_07695 [Capsaspora owczarzaki ATCC 30864]|uniref:NmrA-like domain-containing protein n=1 Tax=Capsaspora owczarzaki (strain ATCC 30864) TaxID=595528 RepID=A0A0D2WX16_CAPO3|nr:hypothetical protein CAOG_07695 [Capsaspora owczarzaki ATCC 30864]KJE97258.1 hypothetical protein CAOG_007695 [Capsaspora owczarzaki ATCC 30864]|eukprot:XP_004343569.1 hypothetical protein CAOG_07695 [Capsaspora owczarzaki ATCC 30864]
MTQTAFKTIAVVGGSGGLGAYLVRALLAAKFDVRVISRPESQAASLSELAAAGATIVRADTSNHDQLVAALRGAEVVIASYGITTLAEQFKLIPAAAAAGVRRYVTGDFGIDPRDAKVPRPFIQFKNDVAAAAAAAGLETTRIYNASFADTTFYDWANLDVASGKITIPGDGTARTAFAHRADVAGFTAAALLHPELSKNAELAIASDILTWNEVVATARKYRPDLQVEYSPLDAIQAKIAADPNPWNTVVLQLLYIFGSGENALTHGSDADKVGYKTTHTLDSTLAAQLKQ